MDERSQSIGLKAATKTLVIAYLYVLMLAIWKYVDSKDIMNSAWEIGFLVLIPFTLLFFARKDESLMLPKTITGDELPHNRDKFAKAKRQKHYLFNACGYAVAFTTLTLIALFFIEKNWQTLLLFPQLNNTLNITIVVIGELMFSFIIFYIINYIWGEWMAKKYRRRLDDLEDEE